jgi:hypothetical protein
MKHRLLLILCAVMAVSTGFSQEPEKRCHSRTGECAGYSSRDATNLSMMGWGVGLVAGIATLCALIPNNATSSHSQSH